MLVLHAALDDDGLLLWGRTGAHDALDTAPSEAVLEQLELIGIDRESVYSCEARLQLPDEDITARAVRLTHAAAVELLFRIDPAATRSMNGVTFAPELGVLRLLLQHAAACVVRQELVPALQRRRASIGDEPTYDAVWRTAPRPAARDAIDVVEARLPDVALRAERITGHADRPSMVDVPRAVRVRRFVDGVADALVRATARQLDPVDVPGPHDRWLDALGADATQRRVTGPGDALDRMSESLEDWSERLLRRTASAFRLCVRLEEPDDPTALDEPVEDGDVDDDGSVVADDAGPTWHLRYLVQARDDPSLLVDLANAWHPRGPDAMALGRRGFHQGEHLLGPLGEAARLSTHIASSLDTREPTGVELDTAGAHEFLVETAPLLEQAGIGVFVPAWWRGRGGRFQVGVRADVHTGFDGGRRSLDSLNLETLVGYDWRVAIGDVDLSHKELAKLAAQKAPLVNVRGRWIEIDPEELRHAIRHVERLTVDPTMATRGTRGEAKVADLVRMALAGGRTEDDVEILGVTGAGIDDLLTQVRDHETPESIAPPRGLDAELRPYQQRGYEWLRFMSSLGLGACLADDMGLGKSIQTLAVVQDAWESAEPDGRRPTLIVAPTSVLTNWAREAQRFTPDLPVMIHHGASRLRGEAFTARATGQAIVVTSYALLARDIDALCDVPWRLAVLDEAQNIKNPGTRAAVAARKLDVPARIALTGTPIENHVGDLWSIMQFLVPGLLGRQVDFRRRYLLPIQTGGYPEAAEHLRSLVEPFILRRVKTDRTVISDLPERIETTEYCTLTAEQASLYEAIVRDAEKILRAPKNAFAGIERRGLILATIAKLKQACNHPAQLLGDNSRIEDRSGKLARLEALVEDILDRGERTLVFTQFVEMGTLLQRSLSETFGREVLFLHGGTSRAARDRMVTRFQSPDHDAPPIFVLSLKAGGSGLNLTAATHVVHFDRWWNPATEQQASDRAFRIGQTRDVQVHALVCAGTVEERIDRMIEQKRSVAGAIVGTGERWITELDDDELFGMLALRESSLLQPGRLDDLDKEWRRASL